MQKSSKACTKTSSSSNPSSNGIQTPVFLIPSACEIRSSWLLKDFTVRELHSVSIMKITSIFARVNPETFDIAVGLFARCMKVDNSKNLVSSINSNWIGATCLLIACKYMEATCPALEVIFAFLSEGMLRTGQPVQFLDTVTRLKIATIEVRILRAVDFRVRWNF